MDTRRIIRNGFADVLEWLLGPRIVEDITESRIRIESLSGKSEHGYTTEIFCQEKKYRIRYHRWYVPNRTYYTYRVFCSVFGAAPEDLVQAFSKEVIFPSLLVEWSHPVSQKKAAIEAYLDLVLSDIQLNKKTS